MAERKVLLLLVSIIILFFGVVEGSAQNVISTKNEFGGKTEEEVYLPDDAESGDIINVITYYNDSNRFVEKECFFTEKAADKKGINRGIWRCPKACTLALIVHRVKKI